MRTAYLLALSTTLASPLLAETTRQLDAHEHGVGQLNIAFDGPQIAIELHAPGADIVGFEYMAESDEDRAKVSEALEVLAKPLEIFEFPESAGCNVSEVSAELESEGADDHDAHDHDEHKDDDHKDEAHDDHDHDDHKDEAHDDHDDDAGHTEFHAEYLLTCADTQAVNSISLPYFTAFPNALELEIQIATSTGATAFEVERDSPSLDLSDLN